MRNKLLSSAFMKEDFPFRIMRIEQGTASEHDHEFVELVYVVRGGGRHLFEGEEYDIRAGDVFIINPGESHAYAVRPGEKMEIFNCLFLPSLLPDSLLRGLGVTTEMDYFYVHPFLQSEQRFNHRLNLQGEDAERALGLLEGMLAEFAAGATGYAAVIRLMLLELLLLLSRYYKQNSAARGGMPSVREQERTMTARRVYGYMERHFDKKLSVESLAELFNVSARHLNRIMKNHYGKSVVDVLHEIRIGRAKRLLLETDEKVIAIAMAVGYDDPSFFTRLFQRHVGCSPGKFRTGLHDKEAST